jgi:hypothetical protein
MLTSQHHLMLPHSVQAIDENILSADALLASRQPLRAVPLYERALRDNPRVGCRRLSASAAFS